MTKKEGIYKCKFDLPDKRPQGETSSIKFKVEITPDHQNPNVCDITFTHQMGSQHEYEQLVATMTEGWTADNLTSK
jgi:hypothetical protein